MTPQSMTPPSNFSIFHRRPAAAPALEATPVAAAPEGTAPELAQERTPEPATAAPEPLPEPTPAPPLFQQAGLSSFTAPADQLGLANPSVITVVATLPDERPAALTSAPTGIYRAVDAPLPAPAPPPPAGGEMHTGLARGTRILTARGEIAVEQLEPGDAALALRGPALLPIAWIGRTASVTRAIRIEAGALGRDMPRRPLSLAPDHPVFIDPVPVAARTLVNGSTIKSVDLAESELFQIDVGAPEVLFAEGVPLSSHQRAEQ